MKKYILTTGLLLILTAMMSTLCWATDRYVSVDGSDTQGDGSYFDPWKTIQWAVDHCNTNDTIYIRSGDFLEDPSDVNNCYIYINNKNGITLRSQYESYANRANIVGNYEETVPSAFGFVINKSSNVTFKKLIFDGYNHFPGTSDPLGKAHDTIRMYDTADYTTITQCAFTQMGRSITDDDESDYRFEAIIGAWGKTGDSSAKIENLVIDRNMFFDNPFDNTHAHEIYLTKNSNATVYGNYIVNNGEGHPLKLRHGCVNAVFDSNTVHGAYNCFLGDYPNEGDDYSTGTILRDNIFSDSLSVIDEDIYEGPFEPTPNHIITFEDNTLYEFSTIDSRYIQGIIYKSGATDLYAAHKDNICTKAFLLPYPQVAGPDSCYGVSGDNFYCQGDMCTTDSITDYVIFCTQNSNGQQIVYSDDIDRVYDSSNIFNNTSYPNIKITALCSLESSTYLTAIRDTGNQCVRIYESTTGAVINGIPKLTKVFADADSITAMAYDGSYVVFATCKSGTSKIYKGTLNNLGSATQQGNDISGYVSAMCFARGYLVTAVYDSVQDESKLYYGTSSNPTSSSTNSYSDILFVALTGSYGTGDNDYLYSLIHDTSGGTNCKKIYFSKDVTAYNDQLYFYSQWFKDF